MVERPKERTEPEWCRPVPLEDFELVERVRSGQTEAYGELVEKYQHRVFNACWRICGNLEDARDLTQEAFLKGFEGISSFRRRSGFYTWVFRIAVNLALSRRRRDRRHREVSLEAGSGTIGTQAEALMSRGSPRPDSDVAETAGNAELHGLVAQALHGLELEQRAVIVLRDIEGLDYQEIGEILQIPSGTVKSRLHRARNALREALLPVLGQESQGHRRNG